MKFKAIYLAILFQSNEFETLLQKKILPPMDPELKEKQSKRKHYRLYFPSPLAADMRLVSIAGRVWI